MFLIGESNVNSLSKHVFISPCPNNYASLCVKETPFAWPLHKQKAAY